MAVTVLLFGGLISLLTLTGLSVFADLDVSSSLVLAFALSFSSTVFAVKVLEDKGEMDSRHGRIAIGILIMQDIAAVVFMAFAAGKMPTLWALLLLLLIPARPLLMRLMANAGHGEMLLMFGLVLAVGGAHVFELVGVKGDLGALLLGLLVSTHPKASELAHSLMGFKDLFLVGFFLTIGLSGTPSVELLWVALGLSALVGLKTAGFFWLLTRFRLRARTSVLASLSLANYSEFGLIVGAVAVQNGWLSADWLIVIAIALSISFVAASPLNALSHAIYRRYHDLLVRFEQASHLQDDKPIEADDSRAVVFGMGRVGLGAYRAMREQYGDVVIGIDSDPVLVESLQADGCRVILGDGTDSDFWAKVPKDSKVELVMLALPNFDANLDVAQQLASSPYQGKVAATVKFEDEVEPLQQAGVHAVFNIYDEAGAGFAEHVVSRMQLSVQ
jgi:predicted Kef-type K+ transport protein